MERRLCCFLLLLAIQIVSWVSATSRHFAPNDGVGIGSHPPGQSPQALPVTIDPNSSSKEGYNFDSKIGSTPPSCENKCYGCIPCEAVQVPTTSKQRSQLGIQYANYEPEGWKCKNAGGGWFINSYSAIGIKGRQVVFAIYNHKLTSFNFQDCCPSVKNILLLDSEGKRVAVKYFSDEWPTNNSKLAFEKALFAKTLRTNARMEAEIVMFQDNIVVYKFVQDLHFFVTGGDHENELLLAAVLQGFFDAVTLLLRNNVDKREALENLDLIFLCLDEIVDQGIILETDPSVIAGKVAIHSMDGAAPLAEQTISQALATAREHLTRTLLT